MFFFSTIAVCLGNKNYLLKDSHGRKIKEGDCWEIQHNAVDVDVGHGDARGQVGAPVDPNGQVCHAGGLVQLLYPVVV